MHPCRIFCLITCPSTSTVTRLPQMVRACSYEVGGDVTNPRLANLIERAKQASVPKVARLR